MKRPIGLVGESANVDKGKNPTIDEYDSSSQEMFSTYAISNVSKRAPMPILISSAVMYLV